MTVKQAFEKAYGPLPEGVTGCYVAHWYPYQGANEGPAVTVGHQCYILDRGKWIDNGCSEAGPNIVDIPAHYFKDYFGPEYDEVVNK